AGCGCGCGCGLRLRLRLRAAGCGCGCGLRAVGYGLRATGLDRPDREGFACFTRWSASPCRASGRSSSA
ncbi:hypothetical protein E3T37_14565, partial [Cryobacterium sp. TMT2-10]